MGAGFAVPYATMMIEAQRLYPVEPTRPTALLSMLGVAPAIASIPLLGVMLAAGDGDLAFVLLAAVVGLAGLLNLRQAGGPIQPRIRMADKPVAH